MLINKKLYSKLYKFILIALVTNIFFITGCQDKEYIQSLEDEVDRLKIQNASIKRDYEAVSKLSHDSYNIASDPDKDELQKLNGMIKEKEDKIEKLNKELQRLRKMKTNGSFNLEDIRVVDVQSSKDLIYSAIILETKTGEKSSYLYNDSTKNIVKLSTVSGAKIYWSPSSKHFIVDSGTNMNRFGDLYDINNLNNNKHFSYSSGLYWVSNNEIIYSKENSNIKVESDMDLNGTLDIVKYNIKTGLEKTLLKGDSTYIYMIKSIDESKVIINKIFIGDMKDKSDEELSLNL